jgi:hypothetical protein
MVPVSMVCDHCKRDCQQLMEVLVVDEGISVQMIGCNDCIEILMDKVKTFQNYRHN